MAEDAKFSAFGVGDGSKFKRNPDGSWSPAVGNVCNATKKQYNGSTTTTAKQILAANQKRQGATICNVSASGTLYIGVQGETSSSFGIPIAAGGTYTDIFSYTAWWAAASTGTINYTIIEYE